MTQHTPGDWVRNGNQIVSLHDDEDGTHETLICDVFDEHDWWRHNARLIHAAPALLRAAKLVISRWESGDLAEAVRQLSAAIVEAEGGA